MARENKSPTPLSVMVGDGEFIQIKGKKIRVKPIALIDIQEFVDDDLFLNNGNMFNISDPRRRKRLERWFGGVRDKEGKITKTGYCFDENDNPVTLEQAMEDGWDVVDLREFMKKLCDLSG